MVSDQVCHHFTKDQCIQAKVGQTNQQKRKKEKSHQQNKQLHKVHITFHLASY